MHEQLHTGAAQICTAAAQIDGISLVFMGFLLVILCLVPFAFIHDHLSQDADPQSGSGGKYRN